MPAKSKAQQAVAAIAKHSPSKLYKRNRGMLKMSKSELSKYARTPTKGLPGKKVDKGFHAHMGPPSSKGLAVSGGPGRG